MKKEKLVERFRRQCAALAKTARQIADAEAPHKYASLNVHNFSGDAPVVIQTFATEPSGAASVTSHFICDCSFVMGSYVL